MTKRFSNGRARVILLSGLGVTGAAALLSARDSWIVPNGFEIAASGALFRAGTAMSGEAAPAQAGGDSAAVAATVERFHAALAAGDSAAALALLAPDVVILESGGLESRDDYRAHHLAADIGFARAVPSQRGAIRVRMQGNVAWATSSSTTQGTYRERPINSTGAELMVLSREPEGWKIRAIHWSSRTRRQPGS